MSRDLRKALLVTLVCGLAVAGCGEKEEPTGTLPDAPPATAPTATAPAAFEIRGHYRGRLTQQGLRPFRVDVRVRSLRTAAPNPVRYSGLGCAGHWGFLGKDAGAFRFRERINRGRSRKCKGVGTVTLRPVGADRLTYRFRGGGVTSRGTLVRAGR